LCPSLGEAAYPTNQQKQQPTAAQCRFETVVIVFHILSEVPYQTYPTTPFYPTKEAELFI
jgi:hypothetical protein